MRMRAFLVLALCLCVTPTWALEEFKPLTTLQDAAVATGNGTALDVALYNSVALEVTIATTATVTFEGTVDGSTWASTVCTSIANTSATLVTSATATGTYQCNVAGLSKFRARISSWTSGAVTVKARATTAVISRRGGAGGSGAPTDATYLTTTANGTLSDEVVIGVVDDTVIVANGSTWEAKTLPSCSNGTTSKLLYNSTTNEFSCGTDQDSGAGSGMTHPQVMARASIGF